MPIDITIPDHAVKYLNAPAATKLKALVEAYCNDLLKEASRLEANIKTSSGDPEFTSSMIQDADLLLRRGYSRPKQGRLFVGAQIVAPASGIVTGFLADSETLKDPLWLITFVVLLTITISATVWVVARG